MDGINKKWGVYYLAVFIGFLFVLNALSSTIVSVFSNIEWSQLTPTKKFVAAFLVAQNCSGVVLAYFNKTLVRLEKGLPPGPTDAPNGGTQFPKKSDVPPTPPTPPTP